MVKVKICGITNAQDALAAARAGADALGFNFFPPSPRYVTPDAARAICMTLPPFVAAVGVFVDQDPAEVQEIAQHCGLDYVQLHGHEGRRTVQRLKNLRVIKALRIRGENDLKDLQKYEAVAFLLDAYVPQLPGGTGQTFDWHLGRKAASQAKIIVAGGLTPENVATAVERTRPYGVDVAGGVEQSPGKKSRALMEDFVRAAKAVEL